MPTLSTYAVAGVFTACLALSGTPSHAASPDAEGGPLATARLLYALFTGRPVTRPCASMHALVLLYACIVAPGPTCCAATTPLRHQRSTQDLSPLLRPLGDGS